MDLPCASELVVVAVSVDGSRCTLSFEEGEALADFNVRLEDARGIPLMVEENGLTRWLMARGALWALSPVHALVAASVSGRVPKLPCRLSPPGRLSERTGAP
jgi:hypothetical protein